jgi:hypothetical protein
MLSTQTAYAAGGYLRPCGAVPISSSWQGHKDRIPPSAEPGTDYVVGIGTDVRAATSGVIDDVKSDTSGATGRYVAIRCDDGNYVRYLHLSSIRLSVGTRVSQGTIVASSGASGFGSESGYGAHVHVSLWVGGTPSQLGVSNTTDFETWVSGTPTPTQPQDTIGSVREIAVHNGAWTAIPVGQPMSTIFSAVNMGTGWGDLYGTIGGHLQVVSVSGGAWIRQDSGLELYSPSLTALNVGQGWPQLLAVDRGVIYHVYADSSGWHKMSTGLTTTGKISAVRLPSGEIEAFTNINGVMYVITSHSGWQMGNSGTPIGDNFKAVLVNGSPQIVTNINGVIHIIWPGAGWQLQSTGQPTSGSIAAVDMGGGYPTIISNEGWSLTVTSVINGSWTRQAMGVSVPGNIDALNLGGNFPTIYAS